MDYSIEEGWLDFIYFKKQQIPLSDAERQKRYREKKKSRQRDENVTEGVTQKRRQDNTIQENSSVTAPPPGEDCGDGQLLSNEEMVKWWEEIDKLGKNSGYERLLLGEFQTTLSRRSEADRQEIIRLARERGLTVPNEGS